MRHPLPDRDESGAIAILTALLMVVVLAVAALGVDIATQVNERQKLHDTIDAAAHAGAFRLPNSGTLANSDALAFASNNGLVAPPAVDFFCVVASKLVGGIWVVDSSQIPATCNPASVGGSYTGFRCNASICSIPCNPAAVDSCNTVRVSANKTVPFSFAPVIGINSGSTGAVTSVACKGSCGNIPLNPMNVAVVADRTSSMATADRNMMVAGIKSMFRVMTPSQQYVAFGTIGRSSNSAPSSCKSSASGSSATSGPWMPVPYSQNYLNSSGTDVNTSSQLIQAVNCLTSSSTGTSLAAPMKSAARYLLDPNNLPSPETRTGTPRKVLIFETDGQPNESAATASEPPTLADANDVFSKTDRIKTIGLGTATRYYYNGGHEACENMKKVAALAKTADILVVTIAYNLGGNNCDIDDKTYTGSGTADCKTTAKACDYSVYATSIGTTPTKVTDALAASASPSETGVVSIAQNSCVSSGDQWDENHDGDFFFCASSGTDMQEIFKTAFTQAAKGIRLIALP